ncbi:uncharacterized protein LOC141628910 [Silene latifolia]|uniref:uncharacterized protein LOC141628910 n=1 Tax=Silene latifolia TaxID=37657 RepID=UPI003D76B347
MPIKEHLYEITSDLNQGAFVHGRSILENILICQDLVRLYNRGHGSPRCMFKLELQKAYDSIEWDFIDEIMGALNFPERFRRLVMTCVTTTSFPLNLNGSMFGYFSGKRGLMQGIPSPPFFLLSVWSTYLGSILLNLKLFFCGVDETVRADILQISGFRERHFPFKYLGIPIQPGRLSKQDCAILVGRIEARLLRVIFLIPKSVIKRIEAVCRNFFWDGGTEYNRPPLVAWHTICSSKQDGGLDVKNAEYWNAASVGKLVNWIYTKADRLWVLWVDHVYLKGQGWHT